MKKCSVCGHEHAEGTACPMCAERNRIANLTKMAKDHKMKDEDLDAAIKNNMSPDAFAKKVLDAMKDNNAAAVDLTQAKVAPASGDKPFKSLGENLQAVVRAAKPNAKPDTRLQQIMDAATGTGEAIDSDAGFLVQTDFGGLLLKEAMDLNQLYPRTFNVPIGPGANALSLNLVDETSRATGSRWGGVRVYRVAEAEEATKSKPKFAQKRLQLEKLMGICYATEESLNDATSLGAIIQRAFAEEFDFVINDELVNGLGVGQMQGLLKAACKITVSKETNQTAATIEAANIYKMYAAMHRRGKANFVWLINADCWQQLYQMSMPIGTGGAPLFLPPGGISASPLATLLGRPIMEVEQCQALGTEGDIIAWDPSQYLTINKGGLNSQSSIHVKFTTDETTFKFTMRNNGMSLWLNKMTPYKGTTYTSPIVTLATRS